jgi:radical SAM-linked protein
MTGRRSGDVRALLKFEKKGLAAFLSHRETMRALQRALRISGLPLRFTEGFHPHPRMSFSPALPLGVEAEGEYLEIHLEREVETGEAVRRLNEALPEGLRVREVTYLRPTMPRLSRWARYGLYVVERGGGRRALLLMPLVGEGQGRLRDALEALLPEEERDGLRVTRKGLYASPYEVFEEVDEQVYFYDGESGKLEILHGEGE